MRKFKKHTAITKEKQILPEIQTIKFKAESDMTKQEIDKPACLAPATDENGTKNEISVFVPENNNDILSKQLPDNEKAVDDGGVIERANRVWEQMSLSPIYKMGQIENVLDDNLFAQIIEDNKGNRTVKFCQRYRNGSFSPIMSVLQSDMIMSTVYLCGQGDETEFNVSIKRNIARFKNNLCKEYFGKFRGAPEDAYKVSDIINALYRAIPFLPVSKDDETELKRRQLYEAVIERVDTYISQHVCQFNAYYALTEDDIIYLAQDLNMDKWSLLRQMREYGFLSIQSSASGFQSNVRLKRPDGTTFTEWRYCIYKIQYFTGESNGTDKKDRNDFDF